MADADGDELHGAARLDPVDHLAQMLFQIGAVIDRQRAVIHRRAVRYHHHDAAFLGPRDHAAVRPEQRLAVDIFLQQPFAHHQAEIALGPAPGLIGLLVDDVAQIVEAAGRGRAIGVQPVLARLAALPGAGGEAENLGFHAAPFQRTRQNLGADGGDADGAPAHGAGIVDQQGDDGVAKLGLALALVTERMAGAHDHAGQPRGIQQAFFLIEIPAAVLLRHQAALQAMGQLGDGALQIGELLIEELTQAGELFLIGQIGGLHDLVEPVGPDVIAKIGRLVPVRAIGAYGLHALIAHIAFHHLAIVVHLAVGLLFAVPFGIVVGLGAHFGLAAVALLLVLVLLLVFGQVVFILVAAILALIGFDVALSQIEMFQHGLGERGKGALIVQRHAQRIQIVPGALLDPVPHHVQPGLRRLGGRLPGQPLAHDQLQRGRQRHIVARFGARDGIGAQPLLQRGGQIVADAFHAARSQCVDAGILHRIERRRCHRFGRAGGCVGGGVVVAHAQRELIGITARLRNLLGRQVARGHGQLHVAARCGRRIGGPRHVQLGIMGHGARAAGQRGFQIVKAGTVGDKARSLTGLPPRFRADPCRRRADNIRRPADARPHRIC